VLERHVLGDHLVDCGEHLVRQPPAVLRIDRGGGDAHDDLVVVHALEVDLRRLAGGHVDQDLEQPLNVGHADPRTQPVAPAMFPP
jgi:hypothetical protein